MQYFGTGLEVGGSDPFTSVAPGSGETLYSGSVGGYVAPSAPAPYVPPYVPPLLPPTGDPEQPPQIITDPPRTSGGGGCRTCGTATPPPATVTPGGAGGAGGTVVVPSAGLVQVDSAREVRTDTAPMTPARQAANLLWLIFIGMGLIRVVADK